MQDILQAVDSMVRVHDAWAADDRKGSLNIPPLELEEEFTRLFDVTRLSDVPAPQRTLVKAIESLEMQWNAYTGGQCNDRAEPTTHFWGALKAVIHERMVSSTMTAKRPESVKTLRKQGVGDNQIARFIYGYAGKGPFLEGNAIRHDLIDKEEAESGSVVPADWVPEYEIERLKQHNIDVQHRMSALDKLATVRTVPKETVEGMLRDGANIDQIVKVCGVTEEQVRKVGEVLGIEPKFRENPAACRAPHELPINEAAAKAVGIDTRQALKRPETSKSALVTKDLKAHVIELHEGNPELGAPEIAAELGGKLKPHEVARIIQEHDKLAVKA